MSSKFFLLYLRSSQGYSPGHRRRPVWSLSRPLSSLELARRGGFERPQVSLTHATVAAFNLAASSPRAMSEPLRNCNHCQISENLPNNQVPLTLRYSCSSDSGSPCSTRVLIKGTYLTSSLYDVYILSSLHASRVNMADTIKQKENLHT